MPTLLLAAPLAVLATLLVVGPALLLALGGSVWLADRALAAAERALRRWRREARGAARAVAVVERRVERAVAEEVTGMRAAVSRVAGAGAGAKAGVPGREADGGRRVGDAPPAR